MGRGPVHWWRQILLLSLLLLAGACDTAVVYLPEMRRVPDKQPSMLGEITANTGVLVLPVQGMAAESGDALAAAVADALRKRDVPALTPRNFGGAEEFYGAHRLHAALEARGGQSVLHWSLRAPAGEVVSEFDGPPLPGDTAAASPRMMMQLAQQVAETVSPHLRTPGAPRTFGLAVTVQPIPAAPGDGSQTLPVALRSALRDAGLRLTPAGDSGDEPNTIKISGKVTLTPLGLAQESVWISWHVSDPDGSEIGVVDQRNQIPKGQLDGNWGPLAALIAEGATEGILQLVEDYRRALAEAAEN